MRTMTKVPKFNLDQHEELTVIQALRLARERYLEDARDFESIAAALRRGETVAMFAKGENGAIAADRLQNQFERQAQDCNKLMRVLNQDECDDED